jgi:indolepyruvate ferredoxin oxidoreductase alpha subunit
MGTGSLGIVAVGCAYAKLLKAVDHGIPSNVAVLKLGTVIPLPRQLSGSFLSGKQTVLVLEETEPFVEPQLRVIAQQRCMSTRIEGKQTGQLPREGALTTAQIRMALSCVLGQPPTLSADSSEPGIGRPSQEALCEGCYYSTLFETLQEVVTQLGRHTVVCADPGCGIRIYQPPFEMLHVKQCMGSAIGIASGLSLAGAEALPVALVGDSSFFHSGINGLLSAVSSGAHILVLVLDNGSAALTGAQPHPGSGRDARGAPAPAVQLESVLGALGVNHLFTLDPVVRAAARETLRRAMLAQGVRVVIARGVCVRSGRR